MTRNQRLGNSRKWFMLALGMLAQTASAVFINGMAFLIPALHDDRGLSLAHAGMLVALPTVGVMLTLIAWGVLTDRVGERRVLILGLTLTSAASVTAYFASSFFFLGLCLFLGGMAAASANSASGRVVVGWFPPERRGLAMGIRQMSLPLGVAIGSLTIPTIARDYGIGEALLVPAVICALAAVVCVGIVDPPRPSFDLATQRGLLDNPYRGNGHLWRIHLSSMLLVVPQTVVWTFSLVWLMTDQGWSAATAGFFVTASQVAGALSRTGVGALSDRLSSRMRPLRWVAIASTSSMFVLALSTWMDWRISVFVLFVAAVLTVAPNGLAFTAVAEYSGPFWSGRALGTQNTGQYLVGSLVPPVFGALAAVSFPFAFLISAVLPALSVPLVPLDQEANE